MRLLVKRLLISSSLVRPEECQAMVVDGWKAPRRERRRLVMGDRVVVVVGYGLWVIGCWLLVDAGKERWEMG